VTALEALPTIGVGNVTVRGDLVTGWVVEFIGNLTGQVLPALTGRVQSSLPTGAEILIKVLPATPQAQLATGSGPPAVLVQYNNRQSVLIQRAPLVIQGTWTETGVPATPGWSGTFDTSAVPLSTWDNPAGDIYLELVFAAAYARSGADGITVSDGVARSGTDGQIMSSNGVTSQTAKPTDNGTYGFLVASDRDGVYGRKFVPGDIGRAVTDADGFIIPGTTIVEVIDDGTLNAARLSYQYMVQTLALTNVITYTTAAKPSDVYYSATANWTAADVGHLLTGTSIPAGVRIVSLIDNHYVRMSDALVATGTGLSWSVVGDFSNVFQSASAVFQSGDVGSTIRAPTVLPNDATITGLIDSSHVTLSVRPTVAATGVAWKLIPSRAYPVPTVARPFPGTLTTQETQTIALSQVPIGGQITIQDGYGGSGMPVVRLNCPVTVGDMRNALLQAYPNYGDGTTISETLPSAQWTILFGCKGQQRALLVDDSAAIYENSLLSWVLADGVPIPAQSATGARTETPTGSPPVLIRFGLKYIGLSNVNAEIVMGIARFQRLTDGTNATMVRQKRMQFADVHTPLPINTNLGGMGKSFGSNFYVCGEEGYESRYALALYDVVGVTLPRERTETHNQMRAVIGVATQSKNGHLVDIQLWSVSVSTFVDVHIKYGFSCNGFGLPVDGPGATIIHWQAVGGWEFTPTLCTFGNFDRVRGTVGVKYWQSWSRRLWMGGIWEQRMLYN
jgi:hypothetical protein